MPFRRPDRDQDKGPLIPMRISDWDDVANRLYIRLCFAAANYDRTSRIIVEAVHKNGKVSAAAD